MTTAKAAAARIKSGDTVNVPPFPPETVLSALWDRAEELRDVRMQFNSTAFDGGWLREGTEESFSLDFEFFIGSFARGSADSKRGFYLPNLFSRSFKSTDEQRPEGRQPNVGLVVCSPPNEEGYVHFGIHHWTKRSLVKRADLVIAEVNPGLVSVHGDVFAHVSEFDAFIEMDPQVIGEKEISELIAKIKPEWRDKMRSLVDRLAQDSLKLVFPLLPILDPDTVELQLGLAEPPESFRIFAGYLSEIIEDGDCIQIGVGEPSSLMVKLGAFDKKNDLGLHTEMIAPGTAKLVDAGIINGKRKNQFKGKAVAASWTGGTDEDIAIVENNPAFELYDPEYILDISRIAANDRMVSINNAVSIDLLGQINGESVFGGRMMNGTGGLPEVHIGAFLAKGGKAIILLPATAMGGAVSRIVATQEAGSIITIPRYFADIVITEFGIAHLLGKNHRERAEALIKIAHPDHREELTAQMHNLLSG
ncbi:MAG: acetyl-CoA hydrolase/transferase family protein [Gammaproteobacteria bacterium]|nr:acetyl-CoA hydrolase/transferase family protein [Gammaproteobacteria bacterium]